MRHAADQILDVLRGASDRAYIGEPISQLEHALQCAAAASTAGADDELVLAALLHDIGHLCAPEDAAQMEDVGVLDHETIGARWLLARGVSDRVAKLVRGHVDAKRYLVTTKPSYASRLSPASAKTLEHQGGAMSAAEAKAFETQPLFKQYLQLRSWDEQAKVVDLVVADVDSYRERLLRHLAR